MSDDVRQVVLAMPTYDAKCDTRAAAAHWNASFGEVLLGGKPTALKVTPFSKDGSLLATVFNDAWCCALNRAHDGRGCDYFAMLHADCAPQNGWLDLLIEEMDRCDLDMIGVVAPIKNNLGLTSTALRRPDRDPWRPLCRLTMTELFELPPTFTSEDVGYQLLLNTGCWVCKFNEDWAKQVYFTVNDKIAFNPKTKKYGQLQESEDWFFSSLCNDLGLKIGATRKVQLTHLGRSMWHNSQPWGQEKFDSEYVPESLIPVRQNGFHFPFDVEGWLLPEEGEALAAAADGKRVLEIGSFCGLSTACLGQTAERVTAIDPFDGSATPQPGSTWEKFQATIERYGLREKVEPMIGTTADIAPVLIEGGEKFDLIFIDGAHDYESVASDIRFASELLAADGLLAFHDYRRRPGQHDGRWDPGVKQAVEELLAAGGELVSTHATLAVCKPPAAVLSEV